MSVNQSLSCATYSSSTGCRGVNLNAELACTVLVAVSILSFPYSLVTFQRPEGERLGLDRKPEPKISIRGARDSRLLIRLRHHAPYPRGNAL